jgi:ribosomal protein L40E
MNKTIPMLLAWLTLGTLAGLLIGCGSGGGMAPMSQVGTYKPAPINAPRPRIGVTAFAIDATSAPESTDALSTAAADEMAQLLSSSGRFDVIGRAATEQLLQQQAAAGAIKPGVLLHPINISGIDYLLVGSINDLTIAREPASGNMFDRMKNWVQRSAENKDVIVQVHCGVGFSLIEPATGDIALSSNSEFSRTAPSASLGMDVMQNEVQSATTLPVTQSDRQQIIRLALDDAVRKALPKTDRFLASRAQIAPNPGASFTSAASGAGATTNASPPKAPAAKLPTTAPAGAIPSVAPAAVQPTAAYKIGPVCGAKNDPAAKFCKQCGAKLP